MSIQQDKEYIIYLEKRIRDPFVLDSNADNIKILQHTDLFNRAVEIFNNKRIITAEEMRAISRTERTVIETNVYVIDGSCQSEHIINILLTDWIQRIIFDTYHIEELIPGRLLVRLNGLINQPIKEMIYYPVIRGYGEEPNQYNIFIHYSFIYDDII